MSDDLRHTTRDGSNVQCPECGERGFVHEGGDQWACTHCAAGFAYIPIIGWKRVASDLLFERGLDALFGKKGGDDE